MAGFFMALADASDVGIDMSNGGGHDELETESAGPESAEVVFTVLEGDVVLGDAGSP